MSIEHLTERMGALKNKMHDLETKIKAIKTTKEAGAGLVKATVNGEKRVLSLDIAPSLMQEDIVMLQDLVIASINLAMDEVDEEVDRIREEASIDFLGSLTQG